MTDFSIDAAATKRFAQDVLTGYGADPKEADLVTTALLWCDMRGLTSQGFRRVPIFIERLAAGGICSPCNAEFRRLGNAVEVLEGGGGFGQYLGMIAVERAVELAGRHGVSAVAVRNSNHLGAAGYFAHLAAEKGMVALVTSNAFPTVAALGGLKPVLGTNPLAFAAPRKNGEALIIDMGTTYGSMTATVDRASRTGKVEEGVAIDEQGKPVKDAQKIRDSAVLPLGARGFALGLAVEVLSGVLTGAGYSGTLRSFYRHLDEPGRLGHLIICLDVRAFLPLSQFMDRLESLVDMLKSSGAIDPGQPIRLPGERRWSTDRKNRAAGRIQLDEKTIAAFQTLARRLGLTLPQVSAPTRMPE